MKLHIFVLGLVYSVCFTTSAERLIFPLLLPESQSNVIVTADLTHRQTCPAEYTNLISNTNLFFPAEQKLLKEISLKYRNVTTNCGPTGSVFKGIKLRQWQLGKFSKTLQVSCFVYTNSDAREEITWSYGGTVIAMFRTQSGGGYNVQIAHGRLLQYQGYKNGVLDGLCVTLASDADHCDRWVHFVKGKTVGKFIMWNREGEIIAEANFKEPFDFLGSEIGKFDLAWTEVQTNGTDTIRRTK